MILLTLKSSENHSFKETGCDSVDWIHLAQNKDKWQALCERNKSAEFLDYRNSNYQPLETYSLIKLVSQSKLKFRTYHFKKTTTYFARGYYIGVDKMQKHNTYPLRTE
jgi:hypothetical protein